MDIKTSTLPRRTVVVGTAAAASLAVLGEPAAAAAAPGRLPKRGRWEKLVGEKFTATLEGRTVTLRLDSVEDGAFRPARLSAKKLAKWRRKTYVLRFSTRHEVAQGNWVLRNRRTGRLALLVVPGGPAQGKRAVATSTINSWKG